MSEETAAPEGQAAPPADGAVETSWTAGMSEEMSGFVEAKGFKDADALASSYQSLEKLRGVPADRLMTLPEDMADREAMLPVYSKLGMPGNPDEYTRVLGDDMNTEVYSALAERAHMLGLGDGQFEGLQQVFGEQVQALAEAQEEQAIAAFDTWKSGDPDGFNNAARVMSEVGMKESEVEGILNGDKASLYEFLGKVGARTAESEVIAGEPSGSFSMSPQAAKTKIAELMGDDAFMKQYTSSSKDVRQAAIDRIGKLHEIAAGGN